MSYHAPFVMQKLLNNPLALRPASAEMIVAALSNRLDIGSLISGADRHGPEDMMLIAEDGRVAADVRNAVREAKNPQAGIPFAQRRYTNGKRFKTVGNIAVIEVWGALTRTWGVGPYSGATGYDGIQIQLMDALLDPDIKGIWLDIDSGGGDVNGLFDLVDLTWSSNAKNGGKPIWAMAADHAYSAAFAIGTAADKFFVPRTGGVGSVGVIMLHADYTKMLENEGIKVTVIRSGEKKAKGNPYEELDADTLAHWQEQIDYTRGIFIETVARNMGVSKKSVSETEGLDYMAHQAKAIGFVNDIASEQAAWAGFVKRLGR